MIHRLHRKRKYTLSTTGREELLQRMSKTQKTRDEVREVSAHEFTYIAKLFPCTRSLVFCPSRNKSEKIKRHHTLRSHRIIYHLQLPLKEFRFLQLCYVTSSESLSLASSLRVLRVIQTPADCACRDIKKFSKSVCGTHFVSCKFQSSLQLCAVFFPLANMYAGTEFTYLPATQMLMINGVIPQSL